jgi:nucleoside-diphosphate-sugar epimerase
MTILVTGGNGFIGQSVVRQLVERGETPVVLRHRWQGLKGLESLLPPGDVDSCIHLGWYADTRDYLVNVAENRRSLQDSLDLVEILGVRGCTHFVVAGTSAEYATSDHALSEDTPVEPRSVYGAAKASFHQLLRSSLAPTGMAVSWARIFNVTGPGEHPNRLLPYVARSVLAGREVPLTSGTQVRDFLHVDDVADGLVQVLYAARPGAYNVCSGRGVPLSQVLTELAQALGDSALLKFGERTQDEHDPDRVVGSNAALRTLGWRPRHDLTEALTSVAEYWRAAALAGANHETRETDTSLRPSPAGDT